MSWDWDHLRFFLALADTRTLVAAARELDVSHTTVLRRVKAFELQLGTQLFEHTAQGYQLSHQGESLYVEAVKMKLAIDKVSSQIADADSQAEGEVVITTTDTLAYTILPAILNEITEEYQGLVFSIRMINRIADIDNHEADIAVRTCREPPEQLIGRKVGTIRFVACASGDYVREHSLKSFPSDTDGHRFIVLDDSYRSSPFHIWLDQRIAATTYRTTASNFLCASALCRHGMGITVLPDYMLDGQDQLIRLNTDTPVSTNDLWILSHVNSRHTERVKLTRRLLHKRLTKRFGET